MKENLDLRAPIEILIKNPDPAILQEYFAPGQIEITPRDDNWLLSSERTWEEIDGVLEGRLISFQDFNETEFNTGTNQARIMAYSQMLYECGDFIAGYNSKINNLSNEYENFKEETRGNRSISKGKQSKKILQKWQNTETRIKELDEEKERKSKIGDLILKKAFLDLFSLTDNNSPTRRPMVTENIQDALDETRRIVTVNRTMLGEKFSDSNPIDFLLSNLGNNVDDYADNDLLRRFTYKTSDRIASKRSDVDVIANTLQVFNSEAFGQEDKEKLSHNISLASALFNVMYKKAEYVSRFRTGETQYPYLTFFYDVIASAVSKADPTVVEMSMIWLDRALKNKLGSSDLSNEITKLADNHESLFESTAQVFQGAGYVRLPKSEFKVLSSEDVKQVPPELKNYYLSEENRLLYIIEVTGNQLTETNKGLNQLISTSILNARKKLGMTLEKWQLENLQNNLDTLALKESEGIEISLSNLLSGGRNFIDGLGSTKTSQIIDQNEIDPSAMSLALYQQKDGKKVMHYKWFRQQMSAEPGYFAQKFKENEILSNHISNRSMWFVSPRGDRFKGISDEGLKRNAIDHLTFYVDHNYPREHRVFIKYQEDAVPIQLWLDENQNLLGEGHTPISGDPRLLSVLKNTILQRLFFIKSGLLSEKLENYIPGESDEKEQTMFRRAHYGVLKSTAKRTITMSSPGVDTHAELIKSIYGIDIFDEIKRRRAMGILKPYEYLTFWQEVVKGNVNLFQPNEVIFDPSLINLYSKQ